MALTEPLSVLVPPGAVGPDVLGQCTVLEKDMARMLHDITTEFLRPEVHHALLSPLLDRLRKVNDVVVVVVVVVHHLSSHHCLTDSGR